MSGKKGIGEALSGERAEISITTKCVRCLLNSCVRMKNVGEHRRMEASVRPG